jgi:hypothetical protein
MTNIQNIVSTKSELSLHIKCVSFQKECKDKFSSEFMSHYQNYLEKMRNIKEKDKLNYSA